MRINRTSLALVLTTLLSGSCPASAVTEVSFVRETLHPHPILSEAPSILPIKVEEIALALRWTGEMNRRLDLASQNQHELQRIRETKEEELPRAFDALRGGQASVYRIASKPRNTLQHKSSVFHAKSPYKASACGAQRWGPDLSKYLHTLVNILSLSGNEDDSASEISAMELTLTMIYMDRACSVETPRSDGHIPCPYCTPRTAHRLIVAALLVAVESVRGSHISEQMQLQVSETLNIPAVELEQMVEWLRGALGDQGTFVGSEQLDEFALTWNSRFGAELSAVEATAASVFA